MAERAGDRQRLHDFQRLLVDELDLVRARAGADDVDHDIGCLLYTSPSPRDRTRSRMPSSA